MQKMVGRLSRDFSRRTTAAKPRATKIAKAK
jgi:hypothetical protein